MDTLQLIFQEADTVEFYFSDSNNGGQVPQGITTDLAIGWNTIPHTLGRRASIMQAFTSDNIPIVLDWSPYDPVGLAYSTTNIYVYSSEVMSNVIINVF